MRIRTWVGGLLVLLTVVFGLGCEGEESSNDGAASAPEVSNAPSQNGEFGGTGGESAESQSDAETARTGEEQNATLESGPECESTEDCEAEKVCDCVGKCVGAGLLACQEDINCGSGNYCDSCSKQCFPKKELCESCGVDGECLGTGSKCVSLQNGESICGQGCLSDVGCPVGYSCKSGFGEGNSQCVPESGMCGTLGECEQDDDCPITQICSSDLLCVDGCKDDESCPTGLVCEVGRCIEACTDTSCPEDKICVEGHCTVEGGCITSADCPEPVTYCDLSISLCVPGCQVDSDCKSAGLECVNESCEAKGCLANFYCGFGEVCDLNSGQCVTPDVPHCEECSGNTSACEGGAGAIGSGECVTLQDENGQEKGSFCWMPCSTGPEGACPQGYSCEELDLPDGGGGSSPALLCTRDCSSPVVGLDP